MAAIDRAGRRLERLIGRYFDRSLPESEDLPWYVSPLPEWMEDIGLRLAWPIAIVNLVGTLFGFWYYGFTYGIGASELVRDQLGSTDPLLWPVVPDSPMATLFIALSLIAWRRGWKAEWLHALAFFGCIKLGLWTPFVQAVINGPGYIEPWLYHFLIWSHLAMALEAFLIHRYSEFPIGAVAIAAGWFLFNDVVDYFVPISGDLYHTTVAAEWFTDMSAPHATASHDLAAAAAVALTVLATFLALATRAAKAERGA